MRYYPCWQKAQIVTYALNLQENVKTKFNNKLEQKVELLESEIAIMKTVNNNLVNKKISYFLRSNIQGGNV